jgi:hypothetical protein
MSTSPDLDFYHRREHQERTLAARAGNREGRHAHLELANCYARMIAEAEAGAGSQPVLPPTMPG